MRKGTAAKAYRQAQTPAKGKSRVIHQLPAGRTSPRGFIPHPRFGKNPTIPVCFWCGKARNEVVNLGATCIREAPMTMVIDYRACEVCETKHITGVLFVEVSHQKQGLLPPMTVDQNRNPLYPVARWTVVPKTAKLIAALGPNAQHLDRTSVIYVDTAQFDLFFKDTDEHRADASLPVDAVVAQDAS